MTGALSIIVPVLNEVGEMPRLLEHLRHWQARGCEILVVDGGNHDGSKAAVRQAGFKLIESSSGRARQMNAGAARASGTCLLFLHADTRLPADADHMICAALSGGHVWGRFDIRIDGRPPMLRLVALLINWRSRLSGIATGDQAIFVRRKEFAQIGGFSELPLMEDIDLTRRLKSLSRPACLGARVVTSGRRWEANGVWRTILLMWRLRLAYWLGVPAETLARAYR